MKQVDPRLRAYVAEAIENLAAWERRQYKGSAKETGLMDGKLDRL